MIKQIGNKIISYLSCANMILYCVYYKSKTIERIIIYPYYSKKTSLQCKYEIILFSNCFIVLVYSSHLVRCFFSIPTIFHFSFFIFVFFMEVFIFFNVGHINMLLCSDYDFISDSML